MIILSEVSQREKDKYYMISLIKQTHRQRTDCDSQMGGRMGRDEVTVWDWQIQTVIYRMDKQQGLTV